MLFVEKKKQNGDGKPPWLEGNIGAHEVTAPMRPQDSGRIRDIVGVARGGRFFQRCLLDIWKTPYHPPPQCFMNKRWKFKAATRNWYPIFCDVLVKFLFFRIPFVRNWRGAKMMRYVRVSGFRHSKDRFSQLHRNCKAPKTPGAFYHWLKIISYSK